MRTALKLAALLALVGTSASAPTAVPVIAQSGPTLSSIGPLAFGPDGVLFAADRQAAAIVAINLGAQAAGATAGTADVPGLNDKIAAVLGTAPAEVVVTDLAIHPTSRNAFVSVMRGQGPAAQPALLRVDGAGKIDVVSLGTTSFTRLDLPNPAAVSPNGRGGRAQSITDLAYADGRLYISGLSNEQFASKLWSVAYPFKSADQGTSVEIYHANHDALETRSPVMAFLPYTVNDRPHIIASYTCTPLVRFPVATLKPGEKVVGTTIAEFGAGNQPLDMIAYEKGGQKYLLMSNSRRGVMKIPTAQFGSAPAITTAIRGTGGVPYETITTMTGVEQLDRLDDQRSIVIARAGGRLDLSAVALP
jgi:hypothetical protein